MEYTYLWFIVSIAFFLLEAMGATGIGLFFAAIAAFCVGILVETGILPQDQYLAQGAAFFGLTAFWAVLLWKPLKKLRVSKPAQDHHDMVGRTATVGDEGLVKGKKGAARWSGTTLGARLADDATIDTASAGQELKIIAVDGSTLILAQKDYVIPQNT